jgi:hypothetical protein
VGGGAQAAAVEIRCFGGGRGLGGGVGGTEDRAGGRAAGAAASTRPPGLVVRSADIHSSGSAARGGGGGAAIAAQGRRREGGGKLSGVGRVAAQVAAVEIRWCWDGRGLDGRGRWRLTTSSSLRPYVVHSSAGGPLSPEIPAVHRTRSSGGLARPARGSRLSELREPAGPPSGPAWPGFFATPTPLCPLRIGSLADEGSGGTERNPFPQAATSGRFRASRRALRSTMSPASR